MNKNRLSEQYRMFLELKYDWVTTPQELEDSWRCLKIANRERKGHKAKTPLTAEQRLAEVEAKLQRIKDSQNKRRGDQ